MYSSLQINSMSDSQISDAFKNLFWGEHIACPKCKCIRLYKITTRELWRCVLCRHHFTMKSSTIFHRSKLPMRKCLEAVALFFEGNNALKMSKSMKVQYKTAYMLRMKLETIY